MKKIMAFLLAGILILSLVACSGAPMNEAAPSQGASQDTEAEAPAEAPLEAGEVAIQAPQNGQKLVYRAEYTLESRDFDADRQAILAAVKEQGGYVSMEPVSYTHLAGLFPIGHIRGRRSWPVPFMGSFCCSWTARSDSPIFIRRESAKRWRCLPWIPGKSWRRCS